MYHHAKFNNNQIYLSKTISKLTGNSEELKVKETNKEELLDYETIIQNQQFLPGQPTFMDASFQKNTIEDDNEWDVTQKLNRIRKSGTDGKIPYT